MVIYVNYNQNVNKIYDDKCMLRRPFFDHLTESHCLLCSSLDGSTETFWESGDEDRNKTKTLTVTCNNRHMPSVLCLHIDNTRDLGVRPLTSLHPDRSIEAMCCG